MKLVSAYVFRAVAFAVVWAATSCSNRQSTQPKASSPFATKPAHANVNPTTDQATNLTNPTTSNTVESPATLERLLGHVGDLLADSKPEWLQSLPDAERARTINEINEYSAFAKDHVFLAGDDKTPTWHFVEPTQLEIALVSTEKSIGKLEADVSGPTVLNDNGEKLFHVHFQYAFAPGHAPKLVANLTGLTLSFVVAFRLSPAPPLATLQPARDSNIR